MQVSTCCLLIYLIQVKKNSLKLSAIIESLMTYFDTFFQTLMLTPRCMEYGRNGVVKLNARKMDLKLGTTIVPIFSCLKVLYGTV